MKKIKLFKRLLLVLLLMIMSTHAYAWYLPGNINGKNHSSVTDNNMGGDNEITFYAVQPGTYWCKLTDGTNWKNGDWDAYSGGDGLTISYDNGNIKLVLTKERDIFVQYKATDKVYITTYDPSYHLKYNWAGDGGGWNWSKAMTNNGDGTYSVIGKYNADLSASTGWRYRRYSSDDDSDGSSWWHSGFASGSVTGSPSTGDLCVYTYKPSDNTLTIHKCNSIAATSHIYFDNTTTNWSTSNKYLVIGRPTYRNATSPYMGLYSMSAVSNTKLWYYEYTSSTYADADYYAVAGNGSSVSSDNVGRYALSNGTFSKYTGAYAACYNMVNTVNYIITPASSSNGAAITIQDWNTSASKLNSNQTIKFSVSFDGSDTYSELTSGGNNTPAAITISAYKFSDGTYNSVSNTSNSQTISVGQNSTVSAYVPAAYTGATSLSYTSVNGHFDWIGWYDAANGGSTVSSPYYPKTAGTVYARLRAKKYTVTYNANGGSCATSSAQATAFTSVTLPTPTKDGCTFEGWYDASGTKIGNAGASYTPTADITLYAHYTDNIAGKLFSYIDGHYGAIYKSFNGTNWVTSGSTTYNKTFTNGTTGVKFVVKNGISEYKSGIISTFIKHKGKSTATTDTIFIPTGKIASVKILYGAYSPGDGKRLTVNGTAQTAPPKTLVDAQKVVTDTLIEITLNNQKDTLKLGISNTSNNLYIARVSATITGYVVTYDKGTYGTGTITAGTKTHGSNFTLSSSTFARDGGWVQDGWSTTDGGDKTYNLGGTYSTDAAITLYPHWTCGSASASLSDGAYTVGASALDLRTLWSSSNTTDAPTFSVTDANGTGATIGVDGYSFTATAAGTATISASQTSTTGYCDVAATSATITVSETYSVTYVKNNGSATGNVPTDDNDYTASDSVVVKGPGDLALTGYTFVGWNTANDGSGTYCSPGARLPMSDDVTFYAVWQSASSCPGDAGGTVFELSMKTNTNSKSLGLGESILFGSTYAATLTGGNVAFTDVATRSSERDKTKAKIQKSSSKRDSVAFGGADAMMTIYLDCALAEGDVISLTSYGSKNDLSITTTPANSSTIATSSKSYTIPALSSLIGKRVIYLWRKSNDNSVYLTALTITRPSSAYAITNAEPSNGTIAITDGSSAITEAAEGGDVYITATPNTGYEFTSWDVYQTSSSSTKVVLTDEDDHGSFKMPAYAVTVDATFTAIDYTLTWDMNGGKVTTAGTGAAVNDEGEQSATLNYGDAITTPVVARSGYKFAGWDNGSGIVTPASTMPAGNVTYTAQWHQQFTVTHNLSKTTTSSGTTAYEDEDYSATYVADAGYVLPTTVLVYRSLTNITASCTWDQGEGTLTIPGAQITGDITITVRSVRAECSVTYNGNSPTSGSAPTDSKNYRYGDVVTVKGDNDMTKTDYDFRGWLDDDNDIFYQEGQTFIITDNVTLAAVWEPTSSGGGGTSVYKFQVKTGLGSSTTNINSSVTDASTYMSVLEGGTIPMSLSGNGNIQTKNDSALCLHSTSGLLKPTLTSPKEIKRGDIIKYRSTSNDIRLMVSTSYSATTDVTMPAGNKMVVTSSSMIGESVLNMTKNSADAEIKYFEIYRPGEVLFYAEVNNGIGTGSIGSGTDETEQTAGAVASGHNLSYISGGKLYTKARSAGYVKGATNEIQLSDGASGTYIKVALDKALAEGDIILVNSIAQTYPLGITTSATYSTAIVGPYYVIPAESGMIGEKNIYLWRNSSNSNLRTVAVVRPGSGADTNFDVTFADGTAVTPASHDEWPSSMVGVPSGKKISVDDPITVGYAFLGWYDDEGCSVGHEVDLEDFTVTEDITLYAKWVVNEHTFTGAAGTTAWETDGNWASGTAPNTTYPYSYAQVYIKKPAVMATDTKERVGRVDIVNDGSSNTGKLTINSGAMLIVYDRVYRMNWSTKERLATDTVDVYLGSEFGDNYSIHHKGGINGALIMGKYNGTGVNATVQFASLAWFNSSLYNETDKWAATDINQYIGIPFNELTPNDYDNHDPSYDRTSSMLYSYETWMNNWYPMIGSDKMSPFKGYDILWIRGAQPKFDLKGTLVASENQTINLRSYSGPIADYNENLLANSWAAPINIAKFEEEDFVNAEATIYIFNAGTGVDYGDIGWTYGKTTLPGQYSSLPIEYVKAYYDEYDGFTTIPSMQSFSILSTDGATHSITLDYKRLVYQGAIDYKKIEPMHAPGRAPKAWSKPMEIKIAVEGTKGLSDMVRILEREDFTEGFDNGWEASKLCGIWEAPSLYAATETGSRAVVAVPDVEGQELVFRAGSVDNVYTISFEYKGTEQIYLYDKETQVYTLIETGATYTFATNGQNDDNRFVLTRNYVPAVTTGIDAQTGESRKDVQKVLINDHIYILRDGHIYDTTGKMLK